MEQLLQQRIVELSKCRSDYDELFERFKLITVACEEKEKIYAAKINELTDFATDLTNKNNQLSQQLVNQKTARRSFEKDARMLQEAAKLLELREKDISKTLKATQEANANLLTELRTSTEKNLKLLGERDAFSKIIKEEMVPKQDYELSLQKLAKLSKVMEQEMVVKTQYDQVAEDNKNLKRRIMNEMVDLKEYQELHARHQALERKIPCDYVTKEEYYKLQHLLQEAQDDKRLLEESVQLIEDTRDQNVRRNSENEAKVVFLKGRIEQTEREVADIRNHYDKVLEEVNSLRGENVRSEQARRQAEEKIVALETSKSALMTQLSKAKLAARHEMEVRQAILDEKAVIEKKVEEIKIEFSNKLIDSNHKIKDIFDISEEQIKRNLQAAHEENTNLRSNIDNLLKENQTLRDTIHSMERETIETKGEVNIQKAYLENASRENADLKTDIINLREEKQTLEKRLQEVQKELDEFKVTVFSGLTPTLGKHYLDHAPHPKPPTPTHASQSTPVIYSSPPISHADREKDSGLKLIITPPVASFAPPAPPNPPYLDHVIDHFQVLQDTTSHISNPAAKISISPTKSSPTAQKKSPMKVEQRQLSPKGKKAPANAFTFTEEKKTIPATAESPKSPKRSSMKKKELSPNPIVTTSSSSVGNGNIDSSDRLVSTQNRGKSPMSRRLVANHSLDSPSTTLPRANSTPQRLRQTLPTPMQLSEITPIRKDKTPIHQKLTPRDSFRMENHELVLNYQNNLLLISPEK